MTTDPSQQLPDPPKVDRELKEGDPGWFRPPTAREHWIAVALFGGFAIFFFVFSGVLRGTLARWIFLVLGGFSVIRTLRHVFAARRATKQPPV